MDPAGKALGHHDKGKTTHIVFLKIQQALTCKFVKYSFFKHTRREQMCRTFINVFFNFMGVFVRYEALIRESCILNLH